MSVRGRIGAERRRTALRSFVRGYLSHRAGIAGLVVLTVAVLVAVLAPMLVPAAALSVVDAGGPVLAPPGPGGLLGTDENGRSVLALTLVGTRVSLVVGIAATLLSVLFGSLVGMLAAHFGRFVSAILMVITDFFLVLPSLVLAIVLSTVLERGLVTIVLAIGVTSWASTARLVRAQTMAVEARPYIERAAVLGGGHAHVLGKHVLPAVAPLVLANTTLTVGSAIISESTLSFLGLGDPGSISWGAMLRSAVESGAITAGAWWYLLPPGLAIVAVVLGFTLCGRALEIQLNPALAARA